MNSNLKKTKLAFFIIIFFILSASFVFAAKLETNFPTIAGEKPSAQTTFPEIVKYLFNLAMFVGALGILGTLVWSGFRYITSRNNPAVVSDIKKKIYSAFLGLLILLSAFVILKTINPQLLNLSLPSLKTITSSSIQTPETKPTTITFQEIPLGTIVEDILAGNALTDKDSKIKCYEYDEEGNTKDVNKDGKIDEKDQFNYDKFYCVQLLSEAFRKKTEKLISLLQGSPGPPIVRGLNELLNNCGCSKCRIYPNYCNLYSCGDCSCCEGTCGCCGSARGQNKACLGIDPCPDRAEIDKRRQQIKQVIDGGELIIDKEPSPAYEPQLDPKNNPKILTLEEAKNRIDAFYKDFKGRLDDLKEAEEKMKIRSANDAGKRLTMAEFFALKQTSQKTIEKSVFKGYNPSSYCLEFNCKTFKEEKTTETTGGIINPKECLSFGLNENTNRMCKVVQDEKSPKKITEYYVSSGDGATFYFNEEYTKEEVLPGEEKCVIDPKEEKGIYTGLIPVGLIPIGETVDETEKFAEEASVLFEIMLDSTQRTLNSSQNIYNSPEQCDCSKCKNKSPCLSCPCKSFGNSFCCTIISCQGCSSCFPSETEGTHFVANPCDKFGPQIEEPKPKPDSYVCPMGELKKEQDRIFSEASAPYQDVIKAFLEAKEKAKKEKKYIDVTIKNAQGNDMLVGYLQIITSAEKKLSDLTNSQNLEKEDANRYEILEKLTISRQKLERCVTGFGVAVKEQMTKMRALSCRITWDLERLGNLIILNGFPYPAMDTQLNCYPFNGKDLTAEQKLSCLINIRDTNCDTATYNLLDNYYCCAGSKY